MGTKTAYCYVKPRDYTCERSVKCSVNSSVLSCMCLKNLLLSRLDYPLSLSLCLSYSCCFNKIQSETRNHAKSQSTQPFLHCRNHSELTLSLSEIAAVTERIWFCAKITGS